jgi:hypothetical protein
MNTECLRVCASRSHTDEVVGVALTSLSSAADRRAANSASVRSRPGPSDSISMFKPGSTRSEASS